MTKRILVFSLAYIPEIGGAEVAVKEITDRLARLAHGATPEGGRSTPEGIHDIEFDMLTLRFRASQAPTEKIGNVNVYRIGADSSYLNKILFVPRAAILATKLNAQKKYDKFWVVMTYMLLPIVLMRIFGRNKTPYVLTLQDGDPFERVFRRLRILPFLPFLKYGFRHAEKVQTISTFLVGWAKRMGFAGQPVVIPNGIDVEKFKIQNSKFKNNEIILITTSRLVEKNGIGDVIEALKYLPENVKFWILGGGPLERNLKRLVVSNEQLEARIKFFGHVPPDEIPKYLSQADIFIRPSLSEGMGNSFIEAMAAGLPVIGTPVGGIPDFLKDGETGFFCEPNSPKSITSTVQKILNMPDAQMETILNNSKRMVLENYNWTLISQKMRTFLNL